MSTRYIGTGVARADGPAKVSGGAVYTGDLEHKGQLYAAILRSPVPSGNLISLDIEKAREMPGVRAVITSNDVPSTLAGWAIFDTPLFANKCVRFEGEPIAAVAAETLQQAKDAVKAIDFDIEETPANIDMAASLAPNAKLLHPRLTEYVTIPTLKFNRQGNIASQYEHKEKGFERAFEQAERVIEDTFEFGRQYQAYLEPKGVIAIYRQGRYLIQTGHQYVFNIRDRVAQFLGVKPSEVRVSGQTMGGGFGGKLDYGPEPFAAALSKAANGRPVKLIYSREEDMLVATSRENAKITVRSALDGDGNIIGREFLTDHDNGAYSGELALMAGIALMFCKGLYKAGPVRTRFRLIYTNTAPTGAFRGVSGVPMISAIECHMDHIADKLGVDRREYRQRHLLRDGDKLPNGQPLMDLTIAEKAYAEIEARASWQHEEEAKKPLEGIGIGSCVWLTNPLPAAATVKLNEDGTANVISGACDIGTGAMVQGVVQVVAETIGIEPSDVIIAQPDTDIAAYDGGSQGSRTARAVGRAAQHAANEVRQKVLEEAAPLMQSKAEALDISDGYVLEKADPSKRVPLTDILMMSAFGDGPIVGTGRHGEEPVQFDPGCASGLAFPGLPTPTYHVHFAKVRVCPVTGNVEVVRYIVAQEVGGILNPDGIMGQIQGGVTQGIGYALHEGLRLKNGRYIERSLEAYRLPLALDVPDVEAILLSHPDERGPYGAKGAAEPPIVLAPSVINNAIADAIGVRINKIPITPEDILAALESREVAA